MSKAPVTILSYGLEVTLLGLVSTNWAIPQNAKRPCRPLSHRVLCLMLSNGRSNYRRL